MWNKLPQDNFFVGMIAGLVTLVLSFIALRAVRLAFVIYYDNPYFFPAPRVEFITIVITLIFFRLVIVNMKMDKTGRGMLFVTVILSLVYLFLFFKHNFRLP